MARVKCIQTIICFRIPNHLEERKLKSFDVSAFPVLSCLKLEGFSCHYPKKQSLNYCSSGGEKGHVTSTQGNTSRTDSKLVMKKKCHGEKKV